jgi:hypothetical protein
MQLDERIYGGTSFRPKPIIELDDNNRFFVVGTPWGRRNLAEDSVRQLKDYFLAARVDPEATVPFDRLTCLSSIGNDLRIAMKLTNDFIYHHDNKLEFNNGLELCAIALGEKEFVLAQIGGPFVFLARKNLSITPLSSCLDLPAEFNSPLPPLPANLLGIETTTNFGIHSLRIQTGDKLIFLGRSTVPSALYQIDYTGVDLDRLSRLLAAQDTNEPFWLGILSL